MNTKDTLLIAVDGGGTGCRAAVGTAASGIMGQGKGGPSNINTSFDDTLRNVAQAVDDALVQAGLQQTDLSRATAHIGLAGADTPTTRANAVAALPYERCIVTGDRDTSVVGVLGMDDGFVLALGTGTIIARQKAGNIHTVNGWGFATSDQGSGAWLGRGLLTHVLLAEDGMAEASAFSRRICTQLGGLSGTATYCLDASPGDFASFTPQIFQAARERDPLALHLLRDGAGYLERGLDALGYASGDVLSLAGGVGPHYAPYLSDTYKQALQPSKGNALQGAFWLATQAANVPYRANVLPVSRKPRIQ